MHYHRYYPLDVITCPGTRCTLFVAGCEHHCRGCYNQSTWRVDSGHPFTHQLEDQIIADLNDTRIRRQGLSLSGGDPLHPANLSAVLKLVTRVTEECPDKDIWLWTGYRFHWLSDAQRNITRQINVLIDGKFIESQKDLTLKWRGSKNQRIWYLR